MESLLFILCAIALYGVAKLNACLRELSAARKALERIDMWLYKDAGAACADISLMHDTVADIGGLVASYTEESRDARRVRESS